MTTDHDIEAALRHALHAAVDPVEPAGDGLQIIQRRLQRPRLQRQAGLLLTETKDLIFLIGLRLEPAAARILELLRQALTQLLEVLQSATGAPAASHRRRGAAHRSQPQGRLASRLSPAMSWLRPTLAVAGAVAIVVAGVATLFTLRQTVTDISLLTGGNSHQAPHSPGSSPGGLSAVPSTSSAAPTVAGSTQPSGTKHHKSPAPTCTPTAVLPPAVSPTPSPSTNPSGLPTVTPTATGTAPGPSVSAGATAAATNAPATSQSTVNTSVLTSGCLGSQQSAIPPTP